jgi:phosphoglycolate phosphatase-like HAD superfamily hydrolase
MLCQILLRAEPVSEPDVISFELDGTIVDFTWNLVSAWRDASKLVSTQTGADIEGLHRAILALSERSWPEEARAEQERHDLWATGVGDRGDGAR